MARDVAGILNTLAEITYSFTNTHAMGADKIDHDYATIYLNLTQHYAQLLENPSDNKNRRELASLINYYIIPTSDVQFNDVVRIMTDEGITMNAYQFIQCLYALSNKNSQPLVTKHLPFFLSLPYRQASQLCAYLRQNRTADHLLPTIKRQLPEAYWLSTATFELTLALNHEEEEHATDLQTTSDTPFKPVKSAFIEYLDQINHREPIPDHIQPILSAQLQDLMHLNGSKLHAYLSGIKDGKTEVVHFFDNNLGLINRAESHVVRKLCSFSEQDMADINTLLTTLKTLETPTAHRTLLLYVIAGDINPSHQLIPAITSQVDWISTLGFYRFVKFLEAARTLTSDKFSLISQFGKTIESLSPHCIAPLLQTFRSYDLEDLTTVDWEQFFGLINQIDSNHKHNKNTYELLIELLMSNEITKDHQLIESIFKWIGNDEDQLLHYLLSELNDNTRTEISNIVSNRDAFKDLNHKTMKSFLRSLFKCNADVRAAFLANVEACTDWLRGISPKQAFMLTAAMGHHYTATQLANLIPQLPALWLVPNAHDNLANFIQTATPSHDDLMLADPVFFLTTKQTLRDSLVQDYNRSCPATQQLMRSFLADWSLLSQEQKNRTIELSDHSDEGINQFVPCHWHLWKDLSIDRMAITSHELLSNEELIRTVIFSDPEEWLVQTATQMKRTIKKATRPSMLRLICECPSYLIRPRVTLRGNQDHRMNSNNTELDLPSRLSRSNG